MIDNRIDKALSISFCILLGIAVGVLIVNFQTNTRLNRFKRAHTASQAGNSIRMEQDW